MKYLLFALIFLSIPSMADTNKDADKNEFVEKMKTNLEGLRTNLKDMEKDLQDHAQKQSKRLSEDLNDSGDSALEATQKAIGNIAGELKTLEAKIRGIREEKKAKRKGK